METQDCKKEETVSLAGSDTVVDNKCMEMATEEDNVSKEMNGEKEEECQNNVDESDSDGVSVKGDTIDNPSSENTPNEKEETTIDEENKVNGGVVESGVVDGDDAAETISVDAVDDIHAVAESSSSDNEKIVESSITKQDETGKDQEDESCVMRTVGPQNEEKGAPTVAILPEETDLLMKDVDRHWRLMFAGNNDDKDKLPPPRTMLEQIISKYSSQAERYTLQEDDMANLQANVVTSVERQSQLEQEVTTLRNLREENETKCNYLQNKLVETQKSKASLENLKPLQSKLQQVTSDKQKLEQSMDKLKKKCVERVKLAESALHEERQLNEERKGKMREYVNQKSEELRASADVNSAFKLELRETNDTLRQVKHKLDILTEQYTISQQRNRDVTRELHHLQKNKVQWMEMGENMEAELQKTTMETEEHKHKRLTAKHELMTVLRKLEAEQAITAQLRDSVKFTFTPKALSQQQLLQEGLNELEAELIRLSKRLGKNTKIPTNGVKHSSDGFDPNGSSKSPKSSKRKSRLEVDVTRLLSTLENETQKVSKGIMAFTGCVEQLHRMLDDSGDRTCVDVLTRLLQANQQHRPLVQSMSDNNDDENYEEGAFVQQRS